MQKRMVTGIVVALLVLGAAAAWRLSVESGQAGREAIEVIEDEQALKEQYPEMEPQRAFVERVIDGDTVVLEGGRRVRLIGIDTPESKHPMLPVQRFAAEATHFTRKMVEGRHVTLLAAREPDKYNRLLAYIHVDGMCLNQALIRRGYAYAYTRYPHPRLEDFIKAEREARRRQYGLWNYSLTDGRISNLANRYERLSPEGKVKLMEAWDKLLETHPAP